MNGLAVIGAGYWGRNLVRNYRELGALRLVCETDPAARAAIMTAHPDVTVVETIDAVLTDTQVDAVAIATPAATHGVLVARALAAGKHVFVEKPLCLDLAEARMLAAEADRHGRVLMVGHMLLYHPAFLALKQAIGSGRLGDLRYLYSMRLSLGKIRREENALWSFAPHDVSMILALTERMPRRVTANGGAYLTDGVADTSLSHLAFDDRLQAHIFVSWLNPYKDQRLVVVGSRGMIVFNDVEPAAGKLLYYPHQVGWHGDIPTVAKADAEAIPYEPAEPLRRECEHFLDCIRDGRRPTSDAHEGIRVLTVLDACQRSLIGKYPVEVPAT